jgi:hypothetical protein
MGAIKATYRNGQFVPDEPVDWPDGKRVVTAPEDDPATAGMLEDEQKDDSESIARWLTEFDSIPPLRMTPEEEVEWQAARRAQKEFEKATFAAHSEKLQRAWE